MYFNTDNVAVERTFNTCDLQDSNYVPGQVYFPNLQEQSSFNITLVISSTLAT
jgi:hypothetical protein